MSKKIEQLLEIIEEVRDNYRTNNRNASIREMRIAAKRAVAARNDIEITTVSDAYIRRLRPDIQASSEFDKLLEGWLHDDSTELQVILLKHCIDNNDQGLIKKTFYKATEQDILLSEEFGIDPNDIEFKEGSEKLRIHLIKERNRYLVDRAKEYWNEVSHGNTICAICSFSFLKAYGEIGKGYIEAHHIKPISSLKYDTSVKISDLTPVCSNCHRIIHRTRPWLTIDQLRDDINRA